MHEEMLRLNRKERRRLAAQTKRPASTTCACCQGAGDPKGESMSLPDGAAFSVGAMP